MKTDEQARLLLDACRRRNIYSAGDFDTYDRLGLDLDRLRWGVHAWFCGEGVAHGKDSPKRPHIGWPCERAVKIIAERYPRTVALTW